MDVLPVFEMFYSLQGEGEFCGMPAFFIRLAGCDVACEFCDEKKAWSKSNSSLLSVEEILSRVKLSKAENVVITGGEPSLYDLTELCNSLNSAGLKSFLETAGTNEIKGDFYHITLSPKKNKLPLLKEICGRKIFFNKINSLKVVVDDEDFSFAERMGALISEKENVSLFLQPEWTKKDFLLPAIVEYIKENPAWRLSLQMHKYINQR
ncbi:MAG: 7-carboxy-7-deazaguanine synthase QueE [Bacteroidales bacterium]|nr:7-carboxy-7-deazaguanine synthase QueE [Bacteroidales bacterium]